jgi:hypothetical protein
MNEIITWQPSNTDIIPKNAKTPLAISEYAVQLGNKDKKQIITAFDSGHYEIAINYLWGKTIMALKKELSTVGLALLGEMLGRTDVDEDDELDSILTTKDTIKLAEELGVISHTDAMRLRHTYELIIHFSQLEIDESDIEEIDESEAISALKSCVRGVLGRPKVEVAKRFVDFREMLENETLSRDGVQIDMLKSSPYFFHKLTLNVLMSAAKKNTSANLEHVLANINVLIPEMWDNLRDTEKWQVGYTYAETYAAGKLTTVNGLKSALLKVKGFDFVPENLRSDTFIKAAEAVIKAHEGLNNFYNEPNPVKVLSKLGSTIPIPALSKCFTALLCVVLGNGYGTSWNARDTALEVLNKLSKERWEYYFKHVFPSDTRILNKLQSTLPTENWIKLHKKLEILDIETSNKEINLLIKATKKENINQIHKSAQIITAQYYGEV